MSETKQEIKLRWARDLIRYVHKYPENTVIGMVSAYMEREIVEPYEKRIKSAEDIKSAEKKILIDEIWKNKQLKDRIFSAYLSLRDALKQLAGETGETERAIKEASDE